VHAQLLVVGATRGQTAAGWLLGTVADRVVRIARCPVFVARGTLPGPGRPILCPVDLSAHSKLGFVKALQMARAFEAPLRVLTAIPPASRAAIEALDDRAVALEGLARQETAELVRAHDTRDVSWQADVVAGDPATEIVAAAEPASLVVIASRAFDMLVPASLGDVSSRVVRESRCSVLCLRDLDDAPEVREAQIRRVVALRDQARTALAEGDLERAERDLRIAAAILPGHASTVDDLAAVLERSGKTDAAARHRALARILRASHA
jgi:nucleotide-binding universal stress UspA family protein